MDPMRNGSDDFVTVVSVGNQPQTENFVTVLSIGTDKNDGSNGVESNLEEEVEVYRLPGERLGFGLKFEGGNKTSERVRRLFVQSCAEQSPASRTKCSWGSLGEGDEILSIDGVPVTLMSRLECVRRLKESQLVIKLLVRCRGALKPEVVSAERKPVPERSKIPPELPAAPPPVPPRKLRQARGSADGEANPSPARKIVSPVGQACLRGGSQKSTPYDSCNSSPKSVNSFAIDSPKKSANERSPEFTRIKSEPPEAMVYLDARSQDGSSTHGSTSDDTGSSMSTVVDRISTSDRFSTTSTVSITSELVAEFSRERVESQLEMEKFKESSRDYLESFEQLDRDFSTNPPDYLLKRLANSQAVTHVESRGEAGTLVEKVTAVVAPNTVVIEETMTLQPPLSFQDAPLSYGHEARPGIFYTADLAADSTTHFRPIRDDVSLVESINGDVEADSEGLTRNASDLNLNSTSAPPLPARNHVNCISVNQNSVKNSAVNEAKLVDNSGQSLPTLPPKPLPRKDAKLKRKRLPPPPPPPTTLPRDLPPPVPARNLDIPKQACENTQEDNTRATAAAVNGQSNENILLDPVVDKKEEIVEALGQVIENDQVEHVNGMTNDAPINVEYSDIKLDNTTACSNNELLSGSSGINKVLEIIEMKKVKAHNDSLKNNNKNSTEISQCKEISQEIMISDVLTKDEDFVRLPVNITPAPRTNKSPSTHGLSAQAVSTPSGDVNASSLKNSEHKIDLKHCDTWTDARECLDEANNSTEEIVTDARAKNHDEIHQSADLTVSKLTDNICDSANDSDSSSASDENDYYWQNNLATIGEEEEITSLEYTNVNKEENETEEEENVRPIEVTELQTLDAKLRNTSTEKDERDGPEAAVSNTSTEPPSADKADKDLVNGRMDNCGGGQRLPPDGDEFPAAYHEFSSTSQQYQLVELPMSEKNESYECTSKHPIEETRISSQYIVTSVTEMTISPEVIVKKAAALPQERRHSSTYSSSKINSDSSVVMTEKKIEIAGYYPKESRSEIDGSVKDSTPPPLPLTGPPRIEKPVPLGRTVSIDSSTRKFTSDLRRQDDKSEKSVRDKIAMFSSQSNLQTPLFPANPVLTTSRRLSKYKSNEDFFADDKTTQRDRTAMFAGRTSSSCDLTDNHYGRPPPSLPRTLPPDEVLQSENRVKEVTEEREDEQPDCLPTNFSSRYSTDKIPSINTPKSPRRLQKHEAIDENKSSVSLLTRATSFSGDISSSCDSTPTNHGHISRANSLASTFRRHSEDMRRTSLNQLIEQRKKSISKLRGLVIPEKVAVPVAQPIIDLPEIKSRDSILVNQMPKASIPDKWGSQSSLASNTSTQSVPVKTTTFKIPAPQILPKYSPAFKRKSLTVCGSGSTSSSSNSSLTPPTNPRTSPVSTGAPNDAPKSLESICSPTRSDYSFEYISSSLSPENLRNGRSKPTNNPKKTRPDYDDSDNDSAVSSQSSISRSFSPSTSPVPSERSNLSSERSYSMSLLMEIPSRNYSGNERSQFTSKSVYPAERTFCGESNRSCDSSGSNSRSPPLPEHNPRYSAIPQRQALKRSSSTETNYSTSSSTLTSGSQASAESLSRRVLKPQSVEAINRKNILASARCRSGQNLNGSPLIQRKFSDDEQAPIVENLQLFSTQTINGNNGEFSNGNVKIAYIEVIDNFICPTTEKSNHLPPISAVKSSESSVIQPSNDLKMWVQSEAKSLLIRENSGASENDSSCFSKASGRSIEICASSSAASNKSVNDFTNKEQLAAAEIADDDVIATLTTRSRSRAPINFENVGGALDSSSQMSLEDILSGKAEPQCLEAQSATYARIHEPPHVKSSVKSHLHEPLTKEKTFVSKIPTYGRLKSADNTMDEITGTIERSKNSKIPMQRTLGRRSASVTDVKKAVEKSDYPAANNCHPGISTMHQRYSSLDSSVETRRPVCVSESDRGYTDFGSVSSFASSTSLISQQELAQLLEEASLDDLKGIHDVVVVILHKENPNGSVGITLAGGVDCETKEITVHRVLAHSIADRDGRVQRGDRILSINGRSTRGLTHRESLAILKQPRAEVVLVVSRAKAAEDGNRIKSRTDSVETIVEGFEVNGSDDTAWGPLIRVTIIKDGAGLGFSLEGGRDSPLGDKSLVVKKIFTGGAAEKTGALTAGDQLLEVNGADVTRMSRIEVWSLMKKLNDGEVNLLVRRPATKSS